MRMRALKTKYPSTILILLMFITTISLVPPVYLNANRGADSSDGPLTSSPDKSQDDIIPIEDQYVKINDHSLSESDTIHNGVLNPVVVEQSGYAASENLSARTDTYKNLAYDLPLDSAHQWVADEAEVNVWNLEKIYAINGSFTEGIPGTNVNPDGTVDYYPLGWDANSTDTDTYDDDLQLAAYDVTGRQYVSVESQGGKVGQDRYGHIAGTRIVWSQIVQNTPYTEDFEFSFDYFYLRGPIDGPTGIDPVTGNCSLALFVDGVVVWNMSLLLLSQRSIWYSLENNPITISGVSSSFTLEIGLVIDETLDLNYKTADYDGDPSNLPDGVGNAAYITVFMDDISFIKATPPTAQEVKLEFVRGGLNASLSGSSGLYYASIVNVSYWTTGPVSVALTANTSVSFDYKTRLYSHRFTDSNWEPNIASTGVRYAVEYGNSSELALYSYVGYLGGYEDPRMEIDFPNDWENVTVSDPFLTVQTGECTISEGHLVIPSSLVINYLGWWEVRLDSPNYAKLIVIQKETSPSVWADETIYRVGNTTRTKVTIGTAIDTPTAVDNVNVTWSLPDGSEWTTESLNDGVVGLVTGTPHVLTSGLSPAGEWCVEILWSNGTEIAYDVAFFEVHHSANLVGDPEIIETDTGLVVTGIVRYTDGDTGAYIMDSLATISANWSLSTEYFVANSVKNWWEVSLDTEDIGAGNFIVHVDATRLYYDAASCEIQIISTNVTRLNSPSAPWTSAQWGSEVSLTFNFEVYDSGTDTWGPVVNSSDVTVDLNWTAGYWTVVEDATPGIYLADVDTSAHPSDTYLLSATFEKPDHESKQLFLTLIVSPIASSLVILGDTSARVNISDDYPLKLRFADQTEVPIASASVIVDSITPAVGLSHTSVDEVSGEPGNYSLTLTPTAAGVYTVRFVATEANSEPGSTVFVLVVNDVETSLIVPGGNSFEIGLTDVFNTTFTYETFDHTGIESASISILYSGGTPGGISWDLVEISSGDYSVEFSATLSGTYVVTIAAFKQYYQSASDSFFLVVRDISTNITILNGTAGIVSYGKDYNIVLSYTNGSGFGLEGADISIESVVPETGLSWGSTISGAPGIYSILLTPGTSNTFTVLVRASLPNHQVQFARFTITATAIASSLTVLNTSTSISFDQNYTVYVYYQSEDLVGLESANLSIQNPPVEVENTEFEELGSGYYRVTLNPHEIGTFDLVFRAELTGYQSDTAGFALSASRIQTELQLTSGLSSETIHYLQSSEFDVVFSRTDFNQTVIGADISIQMNPTTGLSWSFIEDSGVYHIQIEPDHVGRWTLTISALKTGYALGSVQFILDVEPITIAAQLLTGTSPLEGEEFPIEISLTQEGTSIPVIGALVEFRMTASGTPVSNFEIMEVTETPGVYRASYTFPLFQSVNDYNLEIRVSKDNYELSGIAPILFESRPDPLRIPTQIATVSGIFAVFLIGFVMSYRVYNTRKRRKNLEALQIKARFDDVSNILGIIALHKKTGLPVYSKMIKGGFEEAMVSAFITAITHFRSEFEMDEKHWEFNVIPISDIISTVPTRSLIVAFITVRPPTKVQEVGMEAFGRATGAMFDELLAEQRSALVDDEQTKILDTLFYDLLDGYLIEKFRTTKDASFPKSMTCLVNTAQQLENGEGFRLEDLAKGMASCGIEETHAYKIVMDAIDDELIEIADEEKTDVM